MHIRYLLRYVDLHVAVTNSSNININ